MSKKIDKKPQVKKVQTKKNQIRYNRLKDGYRWRFLRLNLEYRIGYQKWSRLLEKKKILEGSEGVKLEKGEQGEINIIDEELEDTSVTDTELNDCKKHFCNYWGISRPTDPELPGLPRDVFFSMNDLKPIIYEANVGADIEKHTKIICKKINELLSHNQYYPSPFKLLVLDLRKCEAKDVRVTEYTNDFYNGQQSLDADLLLETRTNPNSTTVSIALREDLDDKYFKKNSWEQYRFNPKILKRTLFVYNKYVELKKEGGKESKEKSIYYAIASIYIDRYLNKNNKDKVEYKDHPERYNSDVEIDIDRAKLFIRNAPFIKF